MMHIIHHHLHLILVYRLKEMCHLSLVCKLLDHMNLVLLRLHQLYHLIHLNHHLITLRWTYWRCITWLYPPPGAPPPPGGAPPPEAPAAPPLPPPDDVIVEKTESDPFAQQAPPPPTVTG